ncbi:RNA polymerase, sigma-24 subunit, ECF subfamily [Alkaliphilus metalliredigens QYMF]|uniref:RNA polymerase, sigma-24 subunit, ECF subfamily n=1 Tax=Alkaliphilus metalliredigens (strain QYMF) TaxID=293826 RepID=A6TX43_ALKMQ|nr:RNA polymerase sigma factor [Alkaliphilus metalliredigens]ABR50761.1 RNA polymerase, sigma-24 subunit, ECF subfamily [Alkaliphilus metalliredigens QYMF]
MEKAVSSKEHIKLQDSTEDIQYSMYKLYYRDVYRTVYYITKNKELSQDLTNEAYLKAYDKLKTLDDINKFKQWICVIAANLAKNHIRKHSKVISFYPMETLADDHITEDIVIENMDKEEQKEKLRNSLEQLDPDAKEIITLRYYHHLTYEDVGKALSLKQGTVKSRLRRAKDKLIKIFNSEGEENEKR